MRRIRQAAMLVALAAVAFVWVNYVSAAEKRQPRAGVKVPQIGGVINVPPGSSVASVVGTVQYDNDIPASRDGANGQPIGNNFNDPWPAHSIAAIAFRLAGCFTTPYVGAHAYIHDINPTLMTVMQLAVFSAGAGPGISCNGAAVYTGMVPAPIMNHTGPFFGGIKNTPFVGCTGMTAVGGTCEGVALSMGTMNPGFGFHGARVNGAMYTAITPVKNAIFRVTGDNLPVELMGFGVK